MAKTALLLLFFFLTLASSVIRAAGEVDQSSYESEDFEVQEEGMMFDHARTGLLYKRNNYQNDENMTFWSQQPAKHNDTTEKKPWTVHISHWEVFPPSSVTIYVLDDTPYQTSGSLIDIQVRIGHADRMGNFVIANTVVRTDIPIQSGWNKIPVNVHNYSGDIFSAFIMAVRPRMAYHPIEFGGHQ